MRMNTRSSVWTLGLLAAPLVTGLTWAIGSGLLDAESICARLPGGGELAVEPNGTSIELSFSDDGNYAVFTSSANNLVVGDTNGVADVFLLEMETGGITRVSVATGGGESNGASGAPSVSSDGRYVAFQSIATNLVAGAGDAPAAADVYLHDRITSETTLVSGNSLGERTGANHNMLYGRALGPDGGMVVFMAADADLDPTGGGLSHLYGRILSEGALIRISGPTFETPGNAESYGGQISPDSTYVAFSSLATNLTESATGGKWNAFVVGESSPMLQVSLSATGGAPNGDSRSTSVSNNGRYIAFESTASNLIAKDKNNLKDVFLRDTLTSTTERVVKALKNAEPNGESWGALVSADGRFVTYTSLASNLVPFDRNGAADVFLFDRLTQITTRVSRAPAMTEPNGGSYVSDYLDIAHGVAFSSTATNIVSSDTNNVEDVFVRTLWASIELVMRKGTIAFSAQPSQDRCTISGDFRFSGFSDDSLFVHESENARVIIGCDAQQYEISIAAGDPGWKTLPNGTIRWKSPAGTTPIVTLTLNPGKRQFSLVASKLEFGEGWTNPISMALELGDDLGMDGAAWTEKPTGFVLR